MKLFRRPPAPSFRGSEAIRSPNDLSDVDDTSFRGETVSGCVEHSSDALGAISASVPCGKLEVEGYFGIGVSILGLMTQDRSWFVPFHCIRSTTDFSSAQCNLSRSIRTNDDDQ